MIEQFLAVADVALETLLVIVAALLFFKVERIEKDIARIAERADAYNARVENLAGRIGRDRLSL